MLVFLKEQLPKQPSFVDEYQNNTESKSFSTISNFRVSTISNPEKNHHKEENIQPTQTSGNVENIGYFYCSLLLPSTLLKLLLSDFNRLLLKCYYHELDSTFHLACLRNAAISFVSIKALIKCFNVSRTFAVQKRFSGSNKHLTPFSTAKNRFRVWMSLINRLWA